MGEEETTKPKSKLVTVKLGSIEEARLFDVGPVEVTKVDRACGEVTLRVLEGSSGFESPRAMEG
jgi:hypothetical protein